MLTCLLLYNARKQMSPLIVSAQLATFLHLNIKNSSLTAFQTQRSLRLNDISVLITGCVNDLVQKYRGLVKFMVWRGDEYDNSNKLNNQKTKTNYISIWNTLTDAFDDVTKNILCLTLCIRLVSMSNISLCLALN